MAEQIVNNARQSGLNEAAGDITPREEIAFIFYHVLLQQIH